MGWRGVRRDTLNAVKRSATASKKAHERAERARLEAMRAAPQHAHYPQVQGYGPPQGQAYGPAPQGYAPYGHGPPPIPTWTTPAQKSGHSAAVILVAVIGSLFFCGTCSAVLVSTSGAGTREAAPAPPVRPVVAPAAARPTSMARSTPAPPAAQRPAPAPTTPSGPRCCDGSPARCTGRGCCSHHGGVCSR